MNLENSHTEIERLLDIIPVYLQITKKALYLDALLIKELINRLDEAEKTFGIVPEESVVFMKKLHRKITILNKIDVSRVKYKKEIESIYLHISKNK
jgi:hypothetical protein